MLLQRKSNYTAAVYLRISRDDGDKVESDSIQNQRDLIREYLKKHPEITKTTEFVDDGYSGTNFERPSFIRMMSEIEKRRIDCVVVKDLSRFGRNYIETGKYLERIFPMYEVRFLSVNDNYDSMDDKNDADQIVIPFKNLINDAYCRDISLKIRSQLDVKRRNGQFIGSFAGYGYDVIKFHYPVLQKHRWLTPIMEVRRWFKLIFCGHAKRTVRELKYNSNISRAEAENAQAFLKNIGL